MSTSVPYTKQWISVDDQLKLLAQRGLVISDMEEARKKLWRVHYYRFSAYLRPFRQTGTESFIAGTTFERVLQIYEFDRRLRLTVLDAIERIEVAVRARVVNHFSSKHGPFGHRDASNFERYFGLTSWLAELDEDVKKSREEFLAHYQGKYAGFPAVPLWMATEVLQFKPLNTFFFGCQVDMRKSIAVHFGVQETVLRSWLKSLNYVRNVCAHHCRLWNRELAIAPKIPDKDRRWKSPQLVWVDRTFAVLLVIRSMLRSLHLGDAWRSGIERDFADEFSDPFLVKGMGMSLDWKNHPVWQG